MACTEVYSTMMIILLILLMMANMPQTLITC